MTTLKDHIADCALKYQALEHRLDILESKMDKVQQTIEGFKDTIITYAVRGAIGLIILMAGAIFVIKL